jgi:hypothetical protein
MQVETNKNESVKQDDSTQERRTDGGFYRPDEAARLQQARAWTRRPRPRILGAKLMTPRAESLEPVLYLAARGWRLLPCVERDKIPLIRDWPRRASCDFDVICRWAQRHERCNWAVATGLGSGVFVIDVDGESGTNLFCSMVEQHTTWARTLTAITARGQHFYFTYPATGTIRNSAGKLGIGLDVRGDGGYVLVPPSIHPSGALYEWTSPSNGFAPVSAPDWLLHEIVTATARSIEPSEIGILPEGRRNDGLTRAGGYFRRTGATLAEIEIVLMEQNARRCRPPLLDTEVRTIAASVCRYEPGGPDPLMVAWQATESEACGSRYERFLSLARQLQRTRPGQPVILPLERIAELMGCDWTLVRRHRRRAVLAGLMRQTADPVPHRRAAEYLITSPLVAENTCPTMETCPTISPIIGLVGHLPKLHGATQPKPMVGYPPGGTLARKAVLETQARLLSGRARKPEQAAEKARERERVQ